MEKGELMLEIHLLPQLGGQGDFKEFKVGRWDQGW